MKANPADLREWANDVDRGIQDHPDAVKNNPDLAADAFRLRNAIRARYDQVNENRDRGLGMRPSFDKNGDLIP